MKTYKRKLIVCFMMIAVINSTLIAKEVHAHQNCLNNLDELYGWVITYVKAVFIMTGEFYRNNDLENMVRLHERLVNSKHINYTELDYYREKWEFITANNSSEDITPIKRLKKYWGKNILWGVWDFNKTWREEVMTGEGMVLPCTKIDDGWFAIPMPAE